jgi:hypothetical protein
VCIGLSVSLLACTYLYVCLSIYLSVCLFTPINLTLNVALMMFEYLHLTFRLNLHQEQMAHWSGGVCLVATPPNSQNWNLKNADFVNIMISKVLRSFPINRNQALRWTDDWYIRILKNKVMKFKKEQDYRSVWLSGGTCRYIRLYINAVTNSVMLFWQYNFYNTIFKIKQTI